MKIKNIEIGNRIGEAKKFRIYLGKTDEGRDVILKVAKTFEDNEALAREAGKFNIIGSFESELTTLEVHQSSPSSHYDWLFAKLTSSFMEPSQGDRRINIFTIPDIELGSLTSLSKLRSEVEIDARTSVWIFGRFLKLYGFFELLSASVSTDGYRPAAKYPLFSPDDYFIGPKEHRLIYYNFSGDLADVVAYDFVKSVAKFMLNWTAPGEEQEDQKYLELLEDFSERGRKSFSEAHNDLYTLIGKLWGYEYHPFTYRERNTINWNKIKED